MDDEWLGLATDLPIPLYVGKTAGSALVQHLADAVVGSLPIAERMGLTGETMLIVGNRAEESTFPYGFLSAGPWT